VKIFIFNLAFLSYSIQAASQIGLTVILANNKKLSILISDDKKSRLTNNLQI